jgi:GNAT superfamily N-acetyltransferase
MDLKYAKITEKDIPDLTQVMTRAFDDDTQKHLGAKKGGPEGYDNGEFFRKWLFPYDESEGYKILLDGQIVGGFIVWVLEDRKNSLGTIFVDPAYQDKGVGTRAWEFIEMTYPDASSWTLGTPSYSTKNHHFYEKCGFIKVREEEAPEHSGTSFIYQKMMGNNNQQQTPPIASTMPGESRGATENI